LAGKYGRDLPLPLERIAGETAVAMSFHFENAAPFQKKSTVPKLPNLRARAIGASPIVKKCRCARAQTKVPL
jgi:hypothetical protein